MGLKRINHFTMYFGGKIPDLVFMPKDIEIIVNNLSENFTITDGDGAGIPTYDHLDIILTEGEDKNWDQHNSYSLAKVKEYKNNGLIKEMSSIVVTYVDGSDLLLPAIGDMQFIETKDNEVVHIAFNK